MDSFKFLNGVKYEPIEKPISETDLENYEQLNNISLPEDYKHFLTHIGNGIRIFMPDGYERVVVGIKKSKRNKCNPLLSQQFIFEKPFYHEENPEPVLWFNDCINPEVEDEEICAQCEHFKQCPFAYVDSMYIDELPYYSGVLPICYAGCTYSYCLILTGSHRGEIWFDNEFHDFIPSKKNFTEFLEWVVRSEFY